MGVLVFKLSKILFLLGGVGDRWEIETALECLRRVESLSFPSFLEIGIFLSAGGFGVFTLSTVLVILGGVGDRWEIETRLECLSVRFGSAVGIDGAF